MSHCHLTGTCDTRECGRPMVDVGDLRLCDVHDADAIYQIETRAS